MDEFNFDGSDEFEKYVTKIYENLSDEEKIINYKFAKMQYDASLKLTKFIKDLYNFNFNFSVHIFSKIIFGVIIFSTGNIDKGILFWNNIKKSVDNEIIKMNKIITKGDPK